MCRKKKSIGNQKKMTMSTRNSKLIEKKNTLNLSYNNKESMGHRAMEQGKTLMLLTDVKI